MSNLIWPPAYAVRHSQRARYLQLRISAKHGLEVIIPAKFKYPNIDQFIESKRAWIESHLKTLVLPATPTLLQLPETIFLAALDQCWPVQYVASNSRLQIITQPHGSLVVMGKTHDIEACLLALKEWIKGKAEVYLRKELAEISSATQLSFKKLTIREQQTRWGSCTAQQAINLNFKLIFLPAHLVRHTLIHELCHTIHLNHGQRFWHLVASFDPLYLEHSAQLRRAQKLVPDWIE